MPRNDDSFSLTIPAIHRPVPGLTGALKLLTIFRVRRVTRRTLGRLDAHLLRDIGLDSQTARIETTKPFWRD